MQFKSVALLGALAGVAFAETTSSLNSTLTSTTSIDIASGCSFKTLTATAQSDLDEISSCEAVKGTVYITGDFGSASIANVKAIYGDLIIKNATQLTNFAADSLNTITGQLSFIDLYILSTISFGSLESIGSINWVTLPAVESTGFAAGVTDCESIYISDTALESLDGINPATVEVFNVNNNKYLASIDSAIETVSSSLTVAYNADDVDITFDSLIWANNITCYNVNSISMPKLQAINSSAGFIESNVESLDFSTVKTIGGDLSILDNNDLTSIDFNNVTKIGGGLVIVNNTALESVEGFESLKSVGGAVNLQGDFKNASFPALSSVRGDLTVETDEVFDCDSFDELEKKGGIQGDNFVCSASTVQSSSSSSSSKSTKTSDSASSSATDEATSTSASSSKAKGAAAGNAVGSLSVVGSLVFVALSLL